jgi:AhpD family alkylhydroperoxidase
MTQRVNLLEKGQKAFKAFYGFNAYLAKSSLDETLINLLSLRVSQINGCAFCLDMHAKDLRAAGESEQRIYMMNAWRESPVYSARERAALAWAEAVTLITEGHVPDAVYAETKGQFSEQELIDLTLAVIAINSYNRMNIAFRMPAGDYVPGQFKVEAN